MKNKKRKWIRKLQTEYLGSWTDEYLLFVFHKIYTYRYVHFSLYQCDMLFRFLIVELLINYHTEVCRHHAPWTKRCEVMKNLFIIFY